MSPFYNILTEWVVYTFKFIYIFIWQIILMYPLNYRNKCTQIKLEYENNLFKNIFLKLFFGIII